MILIIVTYLFSYSVYYHIHNYFFFPFLQIAYETMQFIVANKHLMNGISLSLGGTDPPFSFLAVVHVGLWVIIFISDRVLQYLHHQSQAKGYLEFFRETKELRRIPYAILSIGMHGHKFSHIHLFYPMRFSP